MTRTPAARRRVILAALIALLAPPAAAQPAMLVLDASDSMWGRIDGRTRIDLLRDSVGALMARWPANRAVGLVAYGHRRAQDCADIETLQRPATDAAAVADLARRLTPRGRTPMADALRQAAEALGAAGGSVILVSDGIESCHPDPCAVAQQLARAAPRLVVHTIAFALTDPTALAQLRCMAEVGGGRALLARDGAELAEALNRAAAATAGNRAEAPRAEPVPVPRLVVTLRLCAQCDPLPGEATILVRRGQEEVAVNGDPFGRFFDLPAGEYAVTVATPFFRRGPLPVSVPATGVGRLQVVLDAGWLLGEARSLPSGHEAPPDLGLDWSLAGAGPASPLAGPPFLVPAGTHRLRATLGNAEAIAEVPVRAGEVVVRQLGLRFGILVPEAAEGDDAAEVVVTAIGAGPASFGEWRTVPGRRLPLAPGRYRVEVDRGGSPAGTEVEIAAEAVVTLPLPPAR